MGGDSDETLDLGKTVTFFFNMKYMGDSYLYYFKKKKGEGF